MIPIPLILHIVSLCLDVTALACGEVDAPVAQAQLWESQATSPQRCVNSDFT